MPDNKIIHANPNLAVVLKWMINASAQWLRKLFRFLKCLGIV